MEKLPAGSPGASNFLSRRSSLLEINPPSSISERTPSELQKQVDGLVDGFVHQASDLKTLAPLIAGGMAYRLGRIGWGLSGGHAVRAASVGLGLSAEVSAFELAHRGLSSVSVGAQDPAPLHANLWRWSGPSGLKEGLVGSFVTFGALKTFGKLTQGQNIILQHGSQATGMVLGHQLVYQTGIGPKPEGTLAEQFLHAEATNLQLMAGMAMGHALTNGRLHAVERGLNLSLSGRDGGWTEGRHRSLPLPGQSHPAFATASSEASASSPPRISAARSALERQKDQGLLATMEIHQRQELRQEIQLSQSISLLEFGHGFESIYNAAEKRAYNKHGLEFEYAVVKRRDFPYLLKIGSAGFCFSGMKFVMEDFFLDPAMDTATRDKIVELIAVHEFGEEIFQNHHKASLLEFAVAEKEGVLERYLEFMDEKYFLKFRDIALNRMGKDLAVAIREIDSKAQVPAELAKNLTEEDVGHPSYEQAKALRDSFRWPPGLFDRYRGALDEDVELAREKIGDWAAYITVNEQVRGYLNKAADAALRAGRHALQSGVSIDESLLRTTLAFYKALRPIHKEMKEGILPKEYVEEEVVNNYMEEICSDLLKGLTPSIQETADQKAQVKEALHHLPLLSNDFKEHLLSLENEAQWLEHQLEQIQYDALQDLQKKEVKNLKGLLRRFFWTAQGAGDWDLSRKYRGISFDERFKIIRPFFFDSETLKNILKPFLRAEILRDLSDLLSGRMTGFSIAEDSPRLPAVLKSLQDLRGFQYKLWTIGQEYLDPSLKSEINIELDKITDEAKTEGVSLEIMAKRQMESLQTEGLQRLVDSRTHLGGLSEDPFDLQRKSDIGLLGKLAKLNYQPALKRLADLVGEGHLEALNLLAIFSYKDRLLPNLTPFDENPEAFSSIEQLAHAGNLSAKSWLIKKAEQGEIRALGTLTKLFSEEADSEELASLKVNVYRDRAEALPFLEALAKIGHRQALEWIPQTSALAILDGRLREIEKGLEDQASRQKALKALSEVLPHLDPKQRNDWISKLEERLGNQDPEIRKQAIDLLSQITPLLDPKDRTDLAFVIEKRLENENQEIAADAAEALKKILPLLDETEPAVQTLRSRLKIQYHRLWGREEMDELLRLFHRLKPEDRLNLALKFDQWTQETHDMRMYWFSDVILQLNPADRLTLVERISEGLSDSSDRRYNRALMILPKVIPHLEFKDRLAFALKIEESSVAMEKRLFRWVDVSIPVHELLDFLPSEDQLTLALKVSTRLTEKDPEKNFRVGLTLGKIFYHLKAAERSTLENHIRSILSSFPDPKRESDPVLHAESVKRLTQAEKYAELLELKNKYSTVSKEAVLGLGKLIPDLDPKIGLIFLLKVAERTEDPRKSVREAAERATLTIEKRIKHRSNVPHFLSLAQDFLKEMDEITGEGGRLNIVFLGDIIPDLPPEERLALTLQLAERLQDPRKVVRKAARHAVSKIIPYLDPKDRPALKARLEPL